MIGRPVSSEKILAGGLYSGAALSKMSRPVSDLNTLLSTLALDLRPGVWAFETTPEPVLLNGAIMLFAEREGWTQIRPATPGDLANNRWCWIELAVYSDLHAVGFIAEISRILAQNALPCNVVAGFNHDHLFIPEDQCARAVEVLQAINGGDCP